MYILAKHNIYLFTFIDHSKLIMGIYDLLMHTTIYQCDFMILKG